MLPILFILFMHGIANCLLNDQKLKWFFVHAVSNISIAIMTFSHLTSHFTGITRDEDKRSIVLVIYTHIYHMLFYKLSSDDILHHFVFLPTIALPGLLYDWKNIGNVQLFFICGIPGAIIYITLILNKTTRWNVNEPLITALVNSVLRMPGILFANYILFTQHHTLSAPAWAIWAQLLLAPTNAVYYTYTAIRRYHKKKGEQ